MQVVVPIVATFKIWIKEM